jgi:type I restriction enzyme S subunit
MIADLKPYPAMKDSGVPWLGEVPEHWQTRRMKTLIRERVQKGFPDEPLLAATQTMGVVRKEQFENRTVVAMKDLHLLKLVHAGDFVISLRSFQGGIEYARQQGIISPAYTVLYPVQPESHGFLAWLFKSKPYVENLSLYVTGIRQGQNIDYEKLSRSELPAPPVPEQAAIVRFLNHADRRIRRYIRAKQKLIKLLEEQRQAIIDRAVTRGLDPNVRLKPSGIEWLGKVPEHWEVLPLRRRCTVIDCKHVTVPFVEDGIPLASVREVQTFDLVLDKAKRTTRDWYEKLVEGDRRPRRGDIIYCRNVSVGAAAIVGSDEPCAMGQDVCLIRSKQNTRYINYFLHSSLMERQIAMVLVGSTFDRINVAEVKTLTIVLPPKAEQDTIAEHLDGAVQSFNAPIELARRQIDLIREYRTRLIADLVTGKLDVRNAAAVLPQEAEELEPLDAAEPEADGEEEVANELGEVLEEAEA